MNLFKTYTAHARKTSTALRSGYSPVRHRATGFSEDRLKILAYKILNLPGFFSKLFVFFLTIF